MFFEVVFADDLNDYKIVPSSTDVVQAVQAIDRVQTELHKWGAANRVSFDPKASMFSRGRINMVLSSSCWE